MEPCAFCPSRKAIGRTGYGDGDGGRWEAGEVAVFKALAVQA